MFPDLEFIKTILNAITYKFRSVQSNVDAVKLDVDAVKSSVPDWNEPDTTSYSYIKGKPCYDYVEPDCVIYETPSAETSGQGALKLIDLIDGYLIEGEKYKLTVDNVETIYICNINDSGELYIGDDPSNCDKSISGYDPKLYNPKLGYDASLYAWTNGLWSSGQSVKLEGALRRHKKLDSSFYDAVASVNDETGDVQITPKKIGAANAGSLVISDHILSAIYGTYKGTDCTALYLGGDRYFAKDTLDDTREVCFSFGPYHTILAGIKNPIMYHHAANKGYVDATVAAARKSIRLYSSTEGSTKQFKLTVNDDGVISATRVVE